jgi:hypothetical protein
MIRATSTPPCRISDALLSAGLSPEVYGEKLYGYDVVDEIHELRMGRYVRWTSASGTVTAGGFIVDVRFGETGVSILVRGSRGRVFQYRFDDCITFQKMSKMQLWISRGFGEDAAIL